MREWGILNLHTQFRIFGILGYSIKNGDFVEVSPRQLEKVLYFDSYFVTDPGDTDLVYKQVLSDKEYYKAYEKYGDKFEAKMGARGSSTIA